MRAPQDTARILICEDSFTYAEALRRFLERDPDLRVVGRCATGEDLLKRLPEVQPDLVTMDMGLPGISGLEAVRRVMEADPLPILVLSQHTPPGSELAAAALGAGALEIQRKDGLRLIGSDGATELAFRRRVKRLARARVAGKRRGGGGRSGVAVPHGRRASVVAIGASTGGPPALRTVLGRLPADFPIPVLVVQHIADGFTRPFARWLDESVAIPVSVPADRAPARPGVWLAPDGVHLKLDAYRRLRLDGQTPGNPHRPQVDVLLRSVAASAGPEAVALVLTGMGRDGGEGTAAVRAAGGLTVAQDEGTSAVYGMPRAATQAGAELVLPLEHIGDLLLALSAERGRA